MLSELTFNGGAAVAACARDNICVSWGNRSGLYLAAIGRRDPIRRVGPSGGPDPACRLRGDAPRAGVSAVTIIPRRDSPNGSDDPVPPDYVVALTSLPHLLSLELSDLVRRDEIPGTRANRYRGRSERLAAFPGLKVGIVWAEDPSFSRCQMIPPSRWAGNGGAMRQGLMALVSGRLAGRRRSQARWW
jgi:hypothetical protein